MKRISSRWLTLSVVFVIATQCCCCIVTPVSGSLVQANLGTRWERAVEIAEAWLR